MCICNELSEQIGRSELFSTFFVRQTYPFPGVRLRIKPGKMKPPGIIENASRDYTEAQLRSLKNNWQGEEATLAVPRL